MTIRAVGLLAASLAAIAGTSPALAQTNRPWVDPPANLAAPAEKPSVAEPKPAPVAAKPAERDEEKDKPAVAKAEPAKVEAPKPVREAAEVKPRPRVKKKVAAAPRPAKVAARPQPSRRIAQRRTAPTERPDGLVVMRMQTLQFPDGRTVTVLTPPDGGSR